MTKKEIIKNNTFIALFMGARYVSDWRFLDNPENPPEPTYVFTKETVPTKHACYNWGAEDLQYHENWNWLMPVLEKIEREHGCIIEMFWSLGRGCKIMKLDPQKHPSLEFTKTFFGEHSESILSVYIAVIQFIDWHFQQTKA